MADAIDARDLSVSLGARGVLHGVSLVARAGEVQAVLGPNGAGKSTLLRALAGLVPCRGEIAIDGVPLAQLGPMARARRISFVPQQTQLGAGLSVEEVVALGRYAHRDALRQLPWSGVDAADRQAIDAALQATDVQALADRPFTDLSTGEQKRVLLARALCTGARTLLLDEPTAALDIEHALRFFVLLRKLAAGGHAVVIVLHQIEHALAFADCALLLARGRVMASGPTASVLTPEYVRALYGVTLVPGGAPGFQLPEEPG